MALIETLGERKLKVSKHLEQNNKTDTQFNKQQATFGFVYEVNNT